MSEILYASKEQSTAVLKRFVEGIKSLPVTYSDEEMNIVDGKIVLKPNNYGLNLPEDVNWNLNRDDLEFHLRVVHKDDGLSIVLLEQFLHELNDVDILTAGLVGVDAIFAMQSGGVYRAAILIEEPNDYLSARTMMLAFCNLFMYEVN